MKDSEDELERSANESAEDDALLSMQIAQRMRTMIATDELKPGERLRERTLAERLDVSRTPLREALKELAVEFRRELSRSMRLRRVPELRFKYDDSVDKGERIESLLRQDASRTPAADAEGESSED